MYDNEKCLTSQQTQEAPQNEEETEKEKKRKEIQNFLKTIESTPDFAYRSKTEPGGCKQIWVRTMYTDDHGKPHDKFVKLVHFRQNCDNDNRAETVIYQDSCDYYITKNSFYGGFRQNKQLFCYDNIVIDIDVHGKPLEWYERELDWEIDRLVLTLQSDYTFPAFNMVRTGRGVQLWIGLESFAAHPKLAKQYTAICDYLCNIVEDAKQVIDSPLDVDRAATKNPSGLVRIPYTANQKRGKNYYTKFDFRTNYKYSIEELLDYIPDELLDDTPSTKKSKTEKPTKKSTPAKFKKINATDNPFEYGICMKRIMFIRQLVQDNTGDCEGRRELLAWAYYNAIVQVMEIAEANKELDKFNQNFYSPLSDSEIDAIVTEFERKREHIGEPITSMYNGMTETGYYIMKTDTFLEKIAATDAEIAMFSKMGAKERERQKKRDAKELRNARIREMHRNGATLKEIAQDVKCTERTIRTVLQAEKQTKETRNLAIIKLHDEGKSVREIAALVGCSSSTVQSVIKSATAASEPTTPNPDQTPETKNTEKIWTKPETYCSAEWCEEHRDLIRNCFPDSIYAKP